MTSRLRSLAESLLLFVGILTLWPWILGHRSAGYMVYSVVVAISLTVLAFVRVRRFRRALDAAARTHPTAHTDPPGEKGA